MRAIAVKIVVAALVLAIAAMIAPSAAVGAEAVGSQPWFVVAGTPVDTDLTGWHERIQIRPARAGQTTYTWVGGYLASGRFVQSGLQSPRPEDARVFAFMWGTFDTSTGSPRWVELSYPVGSWVDFHATRISSTWRFWFVGPDGRRTEQGTVADGTNLAAYQAVAETWDDGFRGFSTQAMRHLAVRRSDGRWTAPPPLVSADPSPVCGQAEVIVTQARNPRGPSLVFRATGNRPEQGCYVRLT